MKKQNKSSKKSQVANQEAVKPSVVMSQDLQNIGAILDHAHPDLTWYPKYGYALVGINKTNHLGEAVGSSGYKAALKKVNGQKPFWRATLPKGQPFVPEEPIDEIVEGLEKRIHDSFPDMKKQNIKIKLVKKRYSHGEDTQHWLVQTSEGFKVENSYRGEKDIVKLGFSIRNGYNTGTSLGIDIFTFAVLCSNGAIMKGTDLAKTSIRHVGNDPKRLVAAFHEALLLAVPEWVNVIKMYNKMAVTKLTTKMAQYIYEQNKKMPEKYFPEYYAIPTKEEKKKAIEKKKEAPMITVTNAGKNVTLWENFNDMTRKLWRATNPELNDDEKDQQKKPIAFSEISWQEKNLHSAMRNILDNPERFV